MGGQLITCMSQFPPSVTCGPDAQTQVRLLDLTESDFI